MEDNYEITFSLAHCPEKLPRRGLLFRLPYLGLLKVAALTPPAWQVTITDEKVEPLNLNHDADLGGMDSGIFEDLDKPRNCVTKTFQDAALSKFTSQELQNMRKIISE